MTWRIDWWHSYLLAGHCASIFFAYSHWGKLLLYCAPYLLDGSAPQPTLASSNPACSAWWWFFSPSAFKVGRSECSQTGTCSLSFPFCTENAHGAVSVDRCTCRCRTVGLWCATCSRCNRPSVDQGKTILSSSSCLPVSQMIGPCTPTWKVWCYFLSDRWS